MGLERKIVLITGAGSGLGSAAAMTFAKEGATVVLCGRKLDKIERVRSEIAEAGGQAVAIQADVSSETEVERLIGEVSASFGRIDILINNAAVFEPGTVSETSLASWNYQFSNNVTSAFLVTRASLALMREQGYGRIVNITSALAHNGSGGFAAYSASKAALESLTRTIADDEIGHDILINMFNPGAIKTDMHATGRDPYSVVPELIKLATLPKHGISGKLIDAAV
ncbi:SDR family NAD(P)-dependent oxidoreductase [Paenibacillus sp. MBLB4367]|uniref:SDR family NAD(P)-dependent oxidoreductase n=1 Tax=Paenibacillus sp. MBLB4367 TaxID=3384767 RepID=UPI003907EE8E